MKVFKAIAYAYPTSINAEELGRHGYYIQQWMIQEDGYPSPPYIAQGHDVFDSLDDPDLVQLLSEHDGEYVSKDCQFFWHYGFNPLERKS